MKKAQQSNRDLMGTMVGTLLRTDGEDKVIKLTLPKRRIRIDGVSEKEKWCSDVARIKDS